MKRDEIIDAAVDDMCEVFRLEHEHDSWFDEDGAGRQYHVLEVWVSERGQQKLHEITRKLIEELDESMQKPRV